MREIARRTGVSEQTLAFGRETLDASVAERVRAAEEAETAGDAGRTRPGLPGALARGGEDRAHAGLRTSLDPLRNA